MDGRADEEERKGDRQRDIASLHMVHSVAFSTKTPPRDIISSQ